MHGSGKSASGIGGDRDGRPAVSRRHGASTGAAWGGVLGFGAASVGTLGALVGLASGGMAGEATVVDRQRHDRSPLGAARRFTRRARLRPAFG
jgi:hypothetical protein